MRDRDAARSTFGPANGTNVARYQPGVGEPPIDTIGFRGSLPERIKRLALTPEKLSPEDNSEIRAHAQKVAAGHDPRTPEFNRLVLGEMDYLLNAPKMVGLDAISEGAVSYTAKLNPEVFFQTCARLIPKDITAPRLMGRTPPMESLIGWDSSRSLI
jgi:hypothetical protein